MLDLWRIYCVSYMQLSCVMSMRCKFSLTFLEFRIYFYNKWNDASFCLCFFASSIWILMHFLLRTFCRIWHCLLHSRFSWHESSNSISCSFDSWAIMRSAESRMSSRSRNETWIENRSSWIIDSMKLNCDVESQSSYMNMICRIHNDFLQFVIS